MPIRNVVLFKYIEILNNNYDNTIYLDIFLNLYNHHKIFNN